MYWVAVQFHHHCKFAGRKLIKENYIQTHNPYSGLAGEMKLQKTNSVKNFRPTIEIRLLKEKPEKQGLKKREISAAELHQGRTRMSVYVPIWRHLVRKRRFSSPQKYLSCSICQSQDKNWCTQHLLALSKLAAINWPARLCLPERRSPKRLKSRAVTVLAYSWPVYLTVINNPNFLTETWLIV